MSTSAEVLDQIDSLISALLEDLDQRNAHLEKIAPEKRASARNLLAYQRFRKLDVRQLQRDLEELGLSRFARAESHILHALNRSHYNLCMLSGVESSMDWHELDQHKAKNILGQNTEQLLGSKSAHGRVRMMVTMPSESASDPQMAKGFLSQGMDCARINCAHDDPAVWKAIIDHLRACQSGNIKIAMDLGGPKLRTGPIEPNEHIFKITPPKDDRGAVKDVARVRVVSSETADQSIGVSDLSLLTPGETIRLVDTRGKKRKIKVVRSNDMLWIEVSRTTYLEKGAVLPANLGEVEVTSVPARDTFLLLNTGDELILTASGSGRSAVIDESGTITKPATISCTLPEIFSSLKEGERIFFDDGKIEGIIRGVSSDQLKIQITNAKPGGAKLKADKGINLPDSNLNISGLTAKDKEDLRFITEHADIVNFSFVNTVEDLEELYELLEEIGNESIGIVLKIETKKAYNNLPKLLMKGLEKKHPIGVMIARGDLAIEVGWHAIGLVQNEILRLCTAAHVPVIWATQVLESLAKKGVPSRSEMTDIDQSIKAECVMLNKGPYIMNAMKLLQTILERNEAYHSKNKTMLPALSIFD